MVEFGVEVPGEYTFVDHSMFRAFNKGAMGMMRVTGHGDEMIYSGRTKEEIYQPGTKLDRLLALSDPPGTELSHDALLARGAQIFGSVCSACHQANAEGLPNTFPPLAKSDFLMADKTRAIGILKNGLKGEITVNGKQYHGEMPKLPLADIDIASVLSYVRNNFGNQGDTVTLAEVRQLPDHPAAPDRGPSQVATR
jgi:nitrite reductase (NO-forming)